MPYLRIYTYARLFQIWILVLLPGCVILESRPAPYDEHKAVEAEAIGTVKSFLNEVDSKHISQDLVTFTAEHLTNDETTIQAASEILAAVQDGSISVDEGKAALEIIHQYDEMSLYQRAVFLSQLFEKQWGNDENNDYWLHQAKHILRKESYPEVILALRKIKEPLDQTSNEDRQSLIGLSLLLQSRPSDARGALSSRQGFPRSKLVDHFNYAMALIRTGERSEGMALLDELGEMPATDPTDQAIRDRENMALAWLWMKAGKGGTARPIFKRVSLEGPYSNMALLGLGWAELVPDGVPQKITFDRWLQCTDVQKAPDGTTLLLFNSYQSCSTHTQAKQFKYYRRYAFEPGSTGKDRYRAALRPWLELGQRDIYDPTVQEAVLAIGYAYSQIGDSQSAVLAYNNAIARYEAEVGVLNNFIKKVSSPDSNIENILDEKTVFVRLPDVISSRKYMDMALESESIQKAIMVHQATARWIRQMTTANVKSEQKTNFVQTEWKQQDSDINSANSKLDSKMRQLVIADITTKRDRLNQYRASAYLSVARLLDRKN